MVGRWPSGAPLALAPDADDPSLKGANDFGYHELDPRGARCPVGSHIRRSHPRDSLDPRPGSSDSWAINRRHRILRRGREYGTSLTIEEAVAGGDTTERGLNFICLNANIQRQFEFINHTWLNNPKFGGLYDDADPVAAPSTPVGASFTIPTDGIRERVTNLPRFVSVRGGAYFFLPGLAALRYLAGIGNDPGNSSSPVGS
jgi:deferrochelatase/peroxidase EfeB